MLAVHNAGAIKLLLKRRRGIWVPQELHHPAVHPWAIDDAIC